jgi:hypothetical protein
MSSTHLSLTVDDDDDDDDDDDPVAESKIQIRPLARSVG